METTNIPNVANFILEYGKTYKISHPYGYWIHTPSTHFNNRGSSEGSFITISNSRDSRYCTCATGLLYENYELIDITNEEIRWLAICTEFNKLVPIKEIRNGRYKAT